MAARGDERARRERIRQNIRAFYEVEESKPAAAAAADDEAGGDDDRPKKDPTKSTDMDIDSQSFNVLRYTTQLLKHQSLHRLVETDNGLRRQVKTLDGDLQSLVYGNYSKFLTAADTIAQVRSNVADMDERLQALAENVASMDAVSHTLTSDLETHRTNIEGVLQVNTVLKKVQFLVRLPDVLRRAVATGRFHEAARYWVAGDAVLAKYAHIAAFQRTREAAQKEAERVYVCICDRVTRTLVPPSGGSGDLGASVNHAAHAKAADAAKAPKAPASTPPATSPSGSPTTTSTTTPASPAPPQRPTIDELSKDVEMLRLLAASSISLERLRAAGAIVPAARDGSIARILYDHVAGRALERFDNATTDACADISDESKKRVTEVVAIVKPSAKGRRGAAEVAAELVVALEKCRVKDVVNALHDATVALRSSLEEVVSVVGRENLQGVDVAAVAMAAAQPALEACVETYSTTTARCIAECALTIARGLGRRCDRPETTPDGAEAARTAAFAVHTHLVSSVKTFAGGLRMVARECLRTTQQNNTAAFAEFMGTELTTLMLTIALTLNDASDALSAQAALDADVATASTTGGSSSSSTSAAVESWTSPLVLSAVMLCTGAMAHTIASLSVDALVAGGPDRVLPGSDESKIRQKFDDARRRLVLSGIAAAGDACQLATVAPLVDVAALATSDAPKRLSGFAERFALSTQRAGSIVDAFVWADKSHGGAKGGAQSNASRHPRTGSTVGSTMSRGSGDSGAQGGARSSVGAGRSNTGGASSAAASGGAVSSKARAPQYLRRDAQSVFTSDVDRLFSRPAGQSVTLRPSQIDGPHVMECVLSHALVTLIDALRHLSFAGGSAAFQQLQVDAAFIIGFVSANAKAWTRKTERVTTLVDELAASAYDRCGHSRAALPPDAVVAIVTSEERRRLQDSQESKAAAAAAAEAA